MDNLNKTPPVRQDEEIALDNEICYVTNIDTGDVMSARDTPAVLSFDCLNVSNECNDESMEIKPSTLSRSPLSLLFSRFRLTSPASYALLPSSNDPKDKSPDSIAELH
jgi:hypothetical protein